MSLHVITTTTMDAGTNPDKDVYIKMVCNWCHEFTIDMFKLSDTFGKSTFRQAFYQAHRHDQERNRKNRKIRGTMG